MSVTPEMQMKIARWRQSAIAGTLSEEECKEAIIFLRGERLAAASAPGAASRAKAVVTQLNANDMLKDLGIL
jgi:hypothetical protein